MNFPALYAEAWTAPRQSMRRILSLGLAERDRLIMVAITGVLFAIPVSLTLRSIEIRAEPGGEILPMPSALQTAVFVVAMIIISYYLTAALIKVVGGLFGGTASYVECKTTSAWTQLVVGLANLALLGLSFVLPGALDTVMRLIFTVAALYVSSAYIAEVHGFQSIAKVIGISLAVSLAAVLLLMSFVPAQMLQPQ